MPQRYTLRALSTPASARSKAQARRLRHLARPVWLVLGGLLAAAVLLCPPPARAQVVAGPGETKTVDFQTIETLNPNTPTLNANGGTIFGEGARLTTLGDSSAGALAQNGGTIRLTDGSITTTAGGNAFGVYATGTGSIITTSGTPVSTNGDGVHAVNVENGGSVTITGRSITTWGDGANGLSAFSIAPDPVSTIITHNTTIDTIGIGSVGAQAGTGSHLTLNDTSITIDGANGIGVQAFAGTTVRMTGGSITTKQDNTPAVQGDTGAVVDLTGVTIVTHGAASDGLVTHQGTMSLTNGSVSLLGSGVTALLAAADGTPSTINVSGSTVTAANGTAVAMQGNSTNVNVTAGSTVTGGTGGLLLVKHNTSTANFGVAILTADASTLTGDIVVDGAAANTALIVLRNNAGLSGDITVDTTNGAFADLIVESGAHFTGATQDVRNVNISSGTWNVTGSSTIANTVTNGGTIAFQPGGAFNTITTIHYVGNGGTLSVNTQLGGDSSPTDQLIVDGGGITGTTGIIVSNAEGTGAQTTGKGIPIVVTINGATSSSGAFTLAQRVAAGAHEYFLFQGPGAAGGGPDDQTSWFLRSQDLSGNTLHRPEVPMHAVYGAKARQLGLLNLGTFHERNGDQRLADTGGRERGWARVFGEHMDQSHSGDVRASFEGNFVGLQGGFDLWQFASLPGHRDNVGLLASHTEGRAHVSGFALGVENLLVGHTDMKATSIGAYWSHIAPTGWYTDVVAMGTIYDGDGRTHVASEVGVDGSGAIVSLEGGFTLARFAGLRLEPQAQLVWQYINLDADDPFAEVEHRTPDAFHGRIGLRLAADNWPWMLRPYLKANVWQDFAGSDRTVYDGATEIVNRHRSTTLELGGGVVANIAPNVGLWASADWATDIGGTEQERESVRGSAGLRVVW